MLAMKLVEKLFISHRAKISIVKQSQVGLEGIKGNGSRPVKSRLGSVLIQADLS
jgi:hypothetical protein